MAEPQSTSAATTTRKPREALMGVIRNITDLIAKVNNTGADEGWNDLSAEQQAQLGKDLWNALPDKPRGLLRNGVIETEEAKELALEATSNCCLKIGQYLLPFLLSAPDQANNVMYILRFFSKYTTGAVLTSCALGRPSGAALSNEDDASSDVVGGTIPVDKIHHSMFKGDDFDEQKFIRFHFPGNAGGSDDDLLIPLGLESDARRKIVEEGAEDLRAVRAFLSRLYMPLESITQAIFYLFLVELLKKIQFEEKLPVEDYTVQNVTGMKTIEVPMRVSRNYMINNALKRKRQLAHDASGIDAMDVTLSVNSDLAICQGSADCHSADSKKQMFLDCKVNIEMKKYTSMGNSKNRRQLTQVAAESLARRKTMKSPPKVLYSILTDVSQVYILLHVLHEGSDPDQYWVSRNEHSPNRFVAIIYWLFLQSVRPDDNLEGFELISGYKDGVSDHQDHDDSQDSDMKTIDEDRASDDNMRLEFGTTSQKGAGETSVMMIDLDDGSDNDEESEQRKWEPFYALRNHRALGTILPFTSNMLNIHNNLEGWEDTGDDQLTEKVRSALNHKGE